MDGSELKEYVERLLEEIDRRNEQRFNAQEKAVESALAASEKAVLKAEASAERRFEGVNEFRQTLSDQAASFLTKSEYIAAHRAVNEKLDDLKGKVDAIGGRSSGLHAGWGYLIGAVGLVATLITVVTVLAR